MYNLIDLSGRCILITGASSGIGRSCSIMCSRLGAQVLLVARDQERLAMTFESLAPGDHRIYGGDISNDQFIAEIFNDIKQRGERVHGLVHAAGLYSMMPLRIADRIGVQKLFEVNYFSFLELARCFVGQKTMDQGSAVAISSVASRSGSSAMAAYGGSKGALDASIRALAIEYAHRRIRFNSIMASYIQTPMADEARLIVGSEAWNQQIEKSQPLGLGVPDDVAHAVAFLLSNAASFITGTSMVVDGGYLAQAGYA